MAAFFSISADARRPKEAINREGLGLFSASSRAVLSRGPFTAFQGDAPFFFLLLWFINGSLFKGIAHYRVRVRDEI